MEKILEGNLARFEIPDLLAFLHMGRRTGVLVLERPEQESKIFLRDGRPVFATSTKDELRFGSVLVRQGRISEADLTRVLGVHRRPGEKIGQVFLLLKLLSPDELGPFLKVQVSEVVFDAFGWKAGLFTFFDKIAPPATVVTLDIELDNLIIEGVRRQRERVRLSEAFPDLNWIADAIANPERIKQGGTLTPDEWQVLFLVDGRRSLNEICRLAGNPDDLATLQVVYTLLAANVIAVVPPRQPAAPVPEAQPAMPEYTQKVVPAKLPQPSPAGPVEVSVSAPPKRLLEDDTKEVVKAPAVQYQAESKGVTVSRLLMTEPGRPDTSLPLTKDTSTLGRHKNNDIVVSDPKVSGFHARIDRGAEGHTLVDLNSRNGTWVNTRRVTTVLLKDGDEIRLGMARLVYKVDYSSGA